MNNLTLIADSGSSKCHWVLIHKKEILLEVDTLGINPFYQTEDEIANKIQQDLIPQLSKYNISNAYFYGAGCAFPEKNQIVHDAIKRFIPNAKIEINSDLLAAARALCGNKSGIACILGTGSNSCFYNGSSIEKNVSPLGFILGDEGSGAVIGKLFIGNMLKNQYPSTFYKEFMEYYQTSPQEIMEHVYKKQFPNRYLAQFTKFIKNNIQEPIMHDLVFNCFNDFISRNIKQYDFQKHPVYFTGSVAFHFETILREVCLAHQICLEKITQSPMAGLIDFHTS